MADSKSEESASGPGMSGRQILDKICFSYLPIVGAASHTLFAMHILDRNLLPGLFPKWHLGVANSLLFNSHLGIGLYVFNRPCLRSASTQQRVLWSVYSSAMFNFGSVLLFATGKQLLTEDKLVGTLYAMSASLCFLVVGKQFFDFLDSRYL
ncbi:uncharacterized protein LOC110986165 [Acanthaster planci]|uniref:Uncharacterized protein LOC110986165 n=1 Tax=Acanthaster planci TaxID=133434 RepID=A0A8B7ZJS0_ACAPL|nr:uncharacterized protein LOC110986165 [Acanthaster planci]